MKHLLGGTRLLAAASKVPAVKQVEPGFQMDQVADSSIHQYVQEFHTSTFGHVDWQMPQSFLTQLRP
jgi:hypothetical protein